MIFLCSLHTYCGKPHLFPWLRFSGDFQTKLPPQASVRPHCYSACLAFCRQQPRNGTAPWFALVFLEWSLSKASDFDMPSPPPSRLLGSHGADREQPPHRPALAGRDVPPATLSSSSLHPAHVSSLPLSCAVPPSSRATLTPRPGARPALALPESGVQHQTQ